MQIMFVCLGNICRSQMAEGIASIKVAEMKLNWDFESSGTGAWHVGEKPDRRAMKTTAGHGIDISNQRAQQFRQQDFDNFDWIVPMDTSNHRDILNMARDETDKSKVRMMVDFLYPGENISIPDPYYNDGFEDVFALLVRSIDQMIEELK
jgi:protein-tyrosine phosphatase